MEKLEPSYTAGGNGKWYRLCGRQPDSSSSGLIIKFPYDLTIPLLVVYLKEMKTYVHTETCIHMFTVSLIIIAKGERTKWPLIGEWIFNNVVHPYHIYYLTIKRSNDSCYNVMNLDNIMLSERSQAQRATCYMIPYIWNVQNREIYGGRKISDCLGLGW